MFVNTNKPSTQSRTNASGENMDLCIDIDATIRNLDKDDLERYEKLFQLCDMDSSGSLTIEGIHGSRKILKLQYVNSLIEMEDWLGKVDSVGDGEIQLREFKVFMHLAENRGATDKIVYLPGMGPKVQLSLKDSTWRQVVWITFDDPESSQIAFGLSVLIMFLIVCSVTAFCVETTALARNPDAKLVLDAVEYTCVVVFSSEYVIRFASAPNRLWFPFGFLNLIDVISVLPFYLNLIVGGEDGGSDILRVVRLARVARVLKLGRYLIWLQLYYSALSKAKVPLAMALGVCLVNIVIFASLIFYAEKGVFDRNLGYYVDEYGKPAVYQSIFDGCYWAIITITSVGYGEKVPSTTIGKVIGMITLTFGVLILAIPISIFSTHFHIEYSELKKKRSRMLQKRRENGDSSVGVETLKHPGELDNEKKAPKKRMSVRSVLTTIETEIKNTRKMEPLAALQHGIKCLNEFNITSLKEREAIRQMLLKTQIQRVVDMKREQLWLQFRIFERKYREQVMKVMLDKYASWFIVTEADRERDIMNTVIKLQAVFRGGMARIVMTSKALAWKRRASQHLKSFTAPGESGALVLQDSSKRVSKRKGSEFVIQDHMNEHNPELELSSPVEDPKPKPLLNPSLAP